MKESSNTIEDISEKVARVSDVYAKNHSIDRSDQWCLLKLQEEIGELTSAFLKLNAGGRVGDSSINDLKKNLEEELADVFCMALLFAKKQNIDIEKAVQEKWFKYL